MFETICCLYKDFGELGNDTISNYALPLINSRTNYTVSELDYASF